MKHRVFLDNGETVDFDDDYKFQIDDNNCLLVTENYRHVENSIIARFSPFVWRYHRLIDEDESEPLSKFLFVHRDGQYEIDTGQQIETATERITYISEHGSKCDVDNWAIVFTFDEHGFQIVDMNDGVDSKTIFLSCALVTDYVVAKIEKVRGLQ